MKTCAWIAMGLGVMVWISGCSRPADNPPSDTPPAAQEQASEAAPAGTTAAPEEVNVTLPEPVTTPAEPTKPAEPVAEPAAEPAKPEEPVSGPEMVTPAAPASEPAAEAKEASPAETPAPAADKPAEEDKSTSGTGKVMKAMGRALFKGFAGAQSSEKPAEEAPKPNQ